MKMASAPPPEGSDNPSCFRARSLGSEDEVGDSVMHFAITKQPKEGYEVMNMMWHSNKLCDVELTVGSESIKAHKLVLAAASPYFRAMFTCGMKECKMKTIPIHGISICDLIRLVKYAYTSEIHITQYNVCSLLPAATLLQMNHVVEACCTFLEHQLDPANCIGIAQFALEHNCVDLHHKANSYIHQHFSEVSHCEEFLSMSPCQLIKLINKDEVNVKCESEVYNAVMSWIGHDKESRMPKLKTLICGVRCHFLTPFFLEKQLKGCEILKKNKHCRDYLVKIFQDLTLHKKCVEKRRNPVAPPVIYCVGGYLRHSLSNVECYNPDSGEWIKVNDLPMPRSGLGVGVVHGKVYAVGGRNNCIEGNVDTNAVHSYEPFNNQWSPCASMNECRNRVGVGVIDGMLYACGGSNACSHLDSVERYNLETDVWEFVRPMHNKRIGLGVAVVNRLLYAIGGFDGQNRLSSMECYHPENDEWRYRAEMNSMRSGAGVTAIDQYIYAVGGYNSTTPINLVERYDTETNQWTVLAPMNRARSALSLASLANRLYALGGYDGQSFLSSVECYDPEKGSWTESTSMTCGRSGHGVSVGLEPCTQSTDLKKRCLFKKLFS